MNVVHRCRFTEWQPSAVISLSIAPSGTTFAALRANGNLEVWTQIPQQNPDSVIAVNDQGTRYELSTFLSRFEPKKPIDKKQTKNQQKQLVPQQPQQTTEPQQTETALTQLASTQEHLYRYASIYYLSSQWVCTTMIPGTGTNVFTQLLWSHVDPIANPTLIPTFNPKLNSPNTFQPPGQIIDRLFTLGSNGRIVEWDLLTSLPKFSTQSHGGSLLCGTVSPSGAQLAAGCQDGTIRIFSIADVHSEPILKKTLTRHSGPIISIDWLHFAHINPPPQPLIPQQHHRPGTVKSTAHQRVESSAWWDPPLIASGGNDGKLKVWNSMTGLCTLELKMDAIRFNVSRRASGRNSKVNALKKSGNKRFMKEVGLKNVAMYGGKISGKETEIKLKKNMQKYAQQLKEEVAEKKRMLKNTSSKANSLSQKTKSHKTRLEKLRDKDDTMFDSEEEDDDDDDDQDEDMEDDDDQDEDMEDEDDQDMGLSDDEKNEDEQEEAEDSNDIGLMPTSKQGHSKGGNKRGEIKLDKLDKKQRRKILLHGGRLKAANVITKLKWLDVETVACLDQTSQLLIINTRTGIIASRLSLQNSLTSPTDLVVIPATVHTASIAHQHNLTYKSRYSYQIHPANIRPGQEYKLLESIFSQPMLDSSMNDVSQTPVHPDVPTPQFIPAYKSKQIYVPHPILYVSGVNGRVIELTATKTTDFTSTLGGTLNTTEQSIQELAMSPFAHACKFVSTGLHTAHSHDILTLTLSPTLVTTHNHGSHPQRSTSQLTLLSAGVDTVIATYGVHPFNINDVNIVKTYFQYFKPNKLKLLSTPPELSLSNYVSPWSHHWTIGKHQAAMNTQQLNMLVNNFKDTQQNTQKFLSKQSLIQRELIETPYHIHTVPGVTSLQCFPMCVCPKCKLQNFPTVMNGNILLRLLYSLHLLPSTNQHNYQINVNNIGKGHLKSVVFEHDDQKLEQNEKPITFYEPQFLFDQKRFDKNLPQTSLLSYIPLNSLELSLQYQDSPKEISSQFKSTQHNTMRIYSPRLISLLKSSPTLQFVQQPAPTAPIFATPRDFVIDIYTLTNHDQLIVRDKFLHDAQTQLACSPVKLNNILCDMQLYQGTVILDRNAVAAALLAVYTSRERQQQHFIQQANNKNLQNQNSKQVIDPQLNALEKEYLYQQSNPHLFRDCDKVSSWEFYEPAFGLTQHPPSTYQSTSKTLDDPDPSQRIESISEDEPVFEASTGKLVKIPTTSQLPEYLLSLRLSLNNVSATTTTQLSPNGRLLLASDSTSIKLWGLEWLDSGSKKHAITPKKIAFPPQIPSLSQYLRSVFDLGQSDGTGKDNFDLSRIPDSLYEKCVEEHYYIELFSQLLAENGCQTASFSPCSSILAVSLAPYAGARQTNYQNMNQFDEMPSEDQMMNSQYPHLGTVILIDLVSYQIMGYIKRSQIVFFSRVFGISLPQFANNIQSKLALSNIMREHYKDEYCHYQKQVVEDKMMLERSKNKKSNKIRLKSDSKLRNHLQKYNTTSLLPALTTSEATLVNISTKKTNNAGMGDDSDEQDSSDSSSDDDDDDDDDDDSDDTNDSDSDSNEHHDTFDMQASAKDKLTNALDEKPTRCDLITQVQFSPCGRYLSTLDKNNNIRLYQLMDKFFTPTMVHLQTISSQADQSATITANSTQFNNNSKGDNHLVTSYQLLPTVTDLKQSHLSLSLVNNSALDENQLIQNINTKQTLQKIIGPSRIDRVLKILFKWAKLCAEKVKNSSNDKDVKSAATSVAAGLKNRASSLFKRAAPVPVDGKKTTAPATTPALTSSKTNSKIDPKNKNKNVAHRGLIVQGDDEFDTDDEDYNEQDENLSVLNQLDPNTLVQLGVNNEQSSMDNDLDDNDNNNFQMPINNLNNQNKNKLNNSRQVKVDEAGYNPYHLLTELLHILLLSQFNTPISQLFLSINKDKKPQNQQNQQNNSFGKIVKEKIENFFDLSSSSINSSYLFNPVNFGYEIHPSICGSYSNGHYFVYDANSKSFLGYDSARPHDVGLKNNIPQPKNHRTEFKNQARIQAPQRFDDITDSTARNHLIQSVTGQDQQGGNQNGAIQPAKLYDPLIPPKLASYYSQVMPFKETALFNEANTQVPALLRADIAPIFSTSHHPYYRPLVSVNTPNDAPHSNVLGGLLSSFNIIFASNDDSYTLSLPLHRVYPAVFNDIITSSYYQVHHMVSILQKLNQNLILSSVNTSTPEASPIAASTAIVEPANPASGKKRALAQVITDPSMTTTNTLFKIGHLHNIDHQQRIKLLMTECFSLLPTQRLRSIGKFRPILFFKFLKVQPTIAISSTKSLFYYINNVMSTYYNYDILPITQEPLVPAVNTKPAQNDDDSDGDDNKYQLSGNVVDLKSKKSKKHKGRESKKVSFAGFNHVDISAITLNTPSVVVETPWIQIVNSLPPAVHKKKWGSM